MAIWLEVCIFYNINQNKLLALERIKCLTGYDMHVYAF